MTPINLGCVNIRIAEEQHLGEIVDLLATRGWANDFAPGLGKILIAIDKSVIACLQVVDVDDETAILDIVLVDEARRREGVGTALVAAATSNSAIAFYVSCRADAVPFYRSLGFTLLDGGVGSAPVSVKEYWREVGNRAPLAMVKHRA